MKNTYATEIKNIKYPTATITIGRFSITYQWLPDAAFCGTAFGWEAFRPDELDGTPEDAHLERVDALLYESWIEEEYMDALITALENNPFQPEGETQ